MDGSLLGGVRRGSPTLAPVLLADIGRSCLGGGPRGLLVPGVELAVCNPRSSFRLAEEDVDKREPVSRDQVHSCFVLGENHPVSVPIFETIPDRGRTGGAT